jgi:hypothetical protein
MKPIAKVSACVLFSVAIYAQQSSTPPAQQTSQDSSTAASQFQPPTPKPVISQSARLAQAKTVYLKQLEGSDIPFNVISNGFDGWAKYMVVSSPEKADLIIEISAPQREDSGFAISSNTSTGVTNGKNDQNVKTTKTFTVSNVRMVVIDSHTKTPLWVGNEQPRSAARKNKTEDNLVDAAQKLFQHFHDRVEPPPAQ